MSADPVRLQALFAAAVELPPEQREAMLERECAGDVALLVEVRALLAADERYCDTTAAPVAREFGALVAGRMSPMRGLRIGPWALRDEIGSGGMGTVYRAERVDGTVTQVVAIKFARRELLDASTLRRFQLERQFMAALDHPHIARLLDAAQLPDGTPYYVMEYVDGVVITDYCERERLDVRQRVELARKVCGAVAEAHRELIVHRDLKPGNILITAGGVPKLLDFGIAKPLRAALDGDETATAQRYFSPHYAAPEQVTGKAVGVACDVYALGLLLYELLAGSRPFDFEGLSAGQIERLIVEVPPAAPSQTRARKSGGSADIRARQLQGDLDGIVLRCLRKDPAERYASVEQLEADLRNYLEGRPVQARGGHRWYRAQKFVLRNKGVVAAGSLAVAALVLGLVAFAWQARVAQARADELEQVAKFQADMLEQVDPTAAGQLLTKDVYAKFAQALEKANVPAAERDAQIALFAQQWPRVNATDAALNLIDGTILKPAVAALGKKFADQPLLDARLSQVLASRYQALGLYEAAQLLQDHALEIRRKLLGAEHADTLASMTAQGELLRLRGKYDESERFLQAALETRLRVLGQDHLDTLTSMDAVAQLRVYQGRPADAEPIYREVLRKRRELLGAEDYVVLSTLNHLVLALHNEGKREEEEALARELLEAKRRISGPDDPDTLDALSLVSSGLMSQNRNAEAEPFVREELDRRRRVLGELNPQTVSTLNRMAVVLSNLRRDAEAEPYYLEALEKSRRVYGADHPRTLTFVMNVGSFYLFQYKLDAAEPYLVEAVEKRRRVYGAEGADTVRAAIRLGMLRRRQSRWAEALAILAPIEDVSRKTFRDGNAVNLAMLLTLLGEVHAGLKDHATAERYLLEADAMYGADPHGDPKLRAASADSLGDLYAAWHKVESRQGYEAKAAQWKQRVEELDPTSSKAVVDKGK